VFATADGVVESIQVHPERGNFIVIRHGMVYQTQYSHLKDIVVKKGDNITAGQVIGHVGNTGIAQAPHLHYEVVENGKLVDPQLFLPEMPGC
jgi:murein DD-endopeptidase MepM/ murein hydrolase activator NlpD